MREVLKRSGVTLDDLGERGSRTPQRADAASAVSQRHAAANAERKDRDRVLTRRRNGTRSAAVVHFVKSTGTRGPKGIRSVVLESGGCATALQTSHPF